MSAAKEIAETAVNDIEHLLSEMFAGNYANNEIALGVLLDGQEEIQIQLKVTRTQAEFIDTDYDDWDQSIKPLDPELKNIA